jgi:two-component system response regulator AtoC
MEAKKINLFIVDDDKIIVTGLKYYLQNRFGESMQISTFYTGESCLEKINKETHIVILDYFLDGKDGIQTLKAIKVINPQTEVIMLTGNEDIAIAIESFRMGAKDYVVKGHSSWKKIASVVSRIITAPIRLLVEEFGVTKYMAIFLLTFVIMGIVVLCTLWAMK